MNELTKCSFCSLRNIQERADKNNQQVILRNSKSKLGGKDVFVVPKGIPTPKIIKAGHEKETRDKFSKNYWVAWFMELTNCCTC